MNKNNEIQIIGILSKGYGIMPKMVALDKNLSIESKAIYAFLTSFSGVGQGVFPSVETIINYLKISENRFYKYRKELIDNGYITVKPRYTNNKRISNIYILNIEKTVHLQNEGIGFEGVEFEGIENEGTNNNNINNNNINNNKDNNSGSDFNILKYAEQRNFILSAIQTQRLLEDVKEYSLAEVKKALDITDDNGKHSYSYFKAVLEKRRSEGVAKSDRNSRRSTRIDKKGFEGNKLTEQQGVELTEEERRRAAELD